MTHLKVLPVLDTAVIHHNCASAAASEQLFALFVPRHGCVCTRLMFHLPIVWSVVHHCVMLLIGVFVFPLINFVTCSFVLAGINAPLWLTRCINTTMTPQCQPHFACAN